MTDLAIRERVAREVMGWVRGSAAAGEPPWLSPVGSATERNQKKYHGMWPEHLLPAYETDIAAAWQVVEKMAEWCVKNGKAHWLPEYGLHELSHMKAERAAGYICLAALAALEAK